MTNELEILEGNIAKINLTVPAKTAQDQYNASLRNFTSHMNIPGFRKGKAPRNMVEKYVGVERIKQEVLEKVFPKAFSQVVDEHKLDVATQPYIETFDFELGKDLTMVVKVELKPEVTIGKYKNNTAEYEEFKPAKDALEKELESVQQKFSTVETIKEDRPAGEKDIAVFDFEGFVDNEPIEHGAGKNYTLDLANSNFIPGFAEGIIGHKRGEEFSIDVTFPENYHQDKLKGAKAVFKINLIDIKERILPELNDDLAKVAGQFESLDALKSDIQKYIDQAAENENLRRKTEAIFNKVVEETKVDIQETMIMREIDAITQEARQAAEARGQSYDALVAAEGKETVSEKFREEAIKRIKNSLIVEKIVKLEDIRIKQEDILGQIGDIARLYHATETQVFDEIRQNPSALGVITQQIAAKKVNDILLENNTFNAK